MTPALYGNFFENLPTIVGKEVFEDVLLNDDFRIERIVSTGQATPPGEWLEEPTNEWVLVLRGAATLQMENEPQPRNMGPGDYLLIPANRRHRVDATDLNQPTIWLAIHYRRTSNTPSTSAP